MDTIGGVGGAAAGAPAPKIRQTYQFTGTPMQAKDSVELSNDVMTVRGTDKLRLDRIMEIRKQLKDGTYLTDEKLDTALDRALDDVLGKL